MDGSTLTLLVQLGVEEAPGIINAIHSLGGSVQNVGPMLDQDKAVIDDDIKTLLGEQADIAAKKAGAN